MNLHADSQLTQREMARLGGLARAKKLSPAKLSEIGRKAGKASGKARRKKKLPQ